MRRHALNSGVRRGQRTCYTYLEGYTKLKKGEAVESVHMRKGAENKVGAT